MVKIETKTVKLSEIRLNPDNPRTISKKDMDLLVKSLKDFPEMLELREIVVDETMTVLGGNMRTLALRKAGVKEATAKIVFGLTPDQKREFVIKDNSNYGTYDLDILANSWGDLPLVDWGVDLPEDWLKKDETTPADAEPQIDKAAELNKIWKVKTGDLWQIGEHRLLCGDSTKREDVERVTKGGVNCTVTDPPYGVGVSYDTFDDTVAKTKELIDGFMPYVFDRLPASIVTGVMNLFDYPRPKWIGTWVHPAAMAPGPWGFNGNNPILYYGKDPYLSSGKGSHPDSVVMATDRDGVDGHPTPKPIKMWEWLIERMTPEKNMIVYEPFGGSGTGLVACQNLLRKCRAIEISPKYCAVILQRMHDAFPDLEIRRVE
jgi:hypothetical protein